MTEVEFEELKLLEEKKQAFRSAARKLNEAMKQLNRLYILPYQRKHLTDEQYAAIVAVRETRCEVIKCQQDLEAGRASNKEG